MAGYLGRDYQIISFPTELLDSLAHDNLGFTIGVFFGTVKEVDTAVIGSLHAFKGTFCRASQSISP